MKFLINRLSDPIGLRQPLPQATQEDFPITKGSVTLSHRWVLEIDELAKLLTLLGEHEKIILSTAPFVSGVVGSITIVDLEAIAQQFSEETMLTLRHIFYLYA